MPGRCPPFQGWCPVWTSPPSRRRGRRARASAARGEPFAATDAGRHTATGSRAGDGRRCQAVREPPAARRLHRMRIPDRPRRGPPRHRIRALDERDHLARHELDVLAAHRPARERIALILDRKVLAGAPDAAVIDPDDHHRRDHPLAKEPVGRLAYPPRLPGKRPRRIEEVLPVVEIEHRNGSAIVLVVPEPRSEDGDATTNSEIIAVNRMDIHLRIVVGSKGSKVQGFRSSKGSGVHRFRGSRIRTAELPNLEPIQASCGGPS